MKSKHRTARRRLRLFTLVEMMIVIIIIGSVLALVGPNLIKSLKKSRSRQARNQIMLLANAVDDYYLDMSEYPASLEDLIRSTGDEKWDGPYLKRGKLPRDPWGQEYIYVPPGEDGEYDIYSLGANKAMGGVDDAKDVHLLETED